MTKDLPSLPGIMVVVNVKTLLALCRFRIATRRTFPPLAIEKILPSLGGQAVFGECANPTPIPIPDMIGRSFLARIAAAPKIGVSVKRSMPRVIGIKGAFLPGLEIIAVGFLAAIAATFVIQVPGRCSMPRVTWFKWLDVLSSFPVVFSRPGFTVVTTASLSVP
jgi:hypothetical protein